MDSPFVLFPICIGTNASESPYEFVAKKISNIKQLLNRLNKSCYLLIGISQYYIKLCISETGIYLNLTKN